MTNKKKLSQCKQCGAEIIKIDTSNGKMICNADTVTYWLSKNPDASILTPNGETIYCVLNGKLEDAHGIGYTLHTCFQHNS